ncbi:MAG: desulfoferrodoxin family protein [Patescibacteria group bacterium]
MKAQKPANPQNLSPLELAHWPQIKLIKPKIGKKFVVQVMVGQKSHEMTAEHLILFIELFVGNQPAGRKILKPGDLPEGEFIVFLNKPAKIIAHAFCNLHGLWENELSIV